MIRFVRGRRLLLIVCETILIVSAVGVAAYIRLGEWAWDELLYDNGAWKALLIAGVAQTCLYYADLYNLKVVSDRRELLIRIVQALGAASFILAAVYYWVPDLVIGRGVFMIAAFLVIAVVVAWRVVFEFLSSRTRPRERLLIVGTSPAAVTLAKELFARRHDLGVEIVGFVDPDPARVGAPVLNPGVIGTIDDIPSIVRARGIDRVVVSLVDARGKLPMDKLLEMRLDRGVAFDHLATVYEEYTGKIAVENLRPSWLIFSEGFRKSAVLEAAKRAVDVFVAGVGLIALAPVMLIVGVAVRIASAGPALYHQQRVGRHGRLFTVHKFRSMQQHAERETGAVWASSKDSRVTPLGRFLRRTRLDELPQLWNVLKGDMSLVGPRPERPEFIAKLEESIPYYGVRHTIRPGLTGWAQICYTYGASVEDALEKLQYDLFYIKHLTIAFDIVILIRTIKTVMLRQGAQ